MEIKKLELVKKIITLRNGKEAYLCPFCGKRPFFGADDILCEYCDFKTPAGALQGVNTWNAVVSAMLAENPPKRFKNAPDHEWKPAYEGVFGEAVEPETVENLCNTTLSGMVFEFAGHGVDVVSTDDIATLSMHKKRQWVVCCYPIKALQESDGVD